MRHATTATGDPISITYSELAAFIDCGLAFRLRNLIGFQPRLAPELGYGKAVHHVMRAVAEATKASGHVPTEAEIDELLDSSFFLPSAPKPAHQLAQGRRQAARDHLYPRHTRPTCTGSGKPSAPSSCTSTA